MKATPGHCTLSNLGTTNKEVFGWDGIMCDPVRLRLVRLTVRQRFNELLAGNDYADPIKVFVKPEPHKPEKMRQKRWRLISAVSLVDTMVDRVLFGWLGRQALQQVGKTPCLVGWSPIRGRWRLMQYAYENKPVCCLDKSSWDWTVQPYMVRLWKRFLKNMAVGAAPWWCDMVDRRFKMLFQEAEFKFSDGTIVKQAGGGIMKSGCYLTLLLNSVSQSMLHYLANYRLGKNPLSYQPHCVGDDTVQVSFPYLEDYVKQFEALGAKVKGFKVQHWVEFCGFAFANNTCFPAYWQKHLYKLRFAPNLEETLKMYQVLYANEPVMLKYLRAVARQLNPALVLSDEEVSAIMNEEK